MSDVASPRSTWQGRLLQVLAEDTHAIRPRQQFFSLLSRAVPAQVGAEFRASLLRLRGMKVGAGTLFLGTPRITIGDGQKPSNLSIGEHCVIDADCILDLGAALTIGDRVTIDREAVILTTTHQLGRREHRAGVVALSPVVIENGAWIGARAVILPGVTVGAGAIVEAGTVLNKSVAANTRVGGSPVRTLEELAP